MTDANPLPPDAENVLLAWIQHEEISAALKMKDWARAFVKGPLPYTYLQIPDDPPFAPLQKPLSEITLGVVTSGGIYLKDEQEPFRTEDPLGDSSLKRVPMDTPHQRLALAHEHYDHTVPLEDMRTIHPGEHLRALVAEGYLGGLHAELLSFQGYNPDWRRVFNRMIPEAIAGIRQAGVDAVLLVPV